MRAAHWWRSNDETQQTVQVEEKVDGTKLTLVRNGKEFDKAHFSKNFIVAYKGTVIYEEDMVAIIEKNARRHSIGNAQYSLIYEHLKKSHSKLQAIPKNTEFFIEFLMEKPTLTRDYKVKHKAVLIGYAKTTFTEEGGRLVTSPKEMQREKVEEYAKLFKIDSPRVLLKGKMFPYKELCTSACDPLFFDLLMKNMGKFDNHGKHVSKAEHYVALTETFLELQSRYGGPMEGVVITLENGNMLKILQPDQHDKDIRRKKKDRFLMSTEREVKYFLEMKSFAREWLDSTYAQESIALKNDILKVPRTFKERLKSLSYFAYQTALVMQYFPHHDKKTMFQKQEDFHYLLKYLFLKDLPENNNALFIGRLQPPSKMHIEIIREGLREYNRVIVAIVKGKKSDIDDNPFSFATQQEILRAAFPKEERLEIIQVATGNLFSAIEKSKRNVNAVLCGEDRANTYSAQLLQNPEIRIVRFLRDMNGVSGTKLREALKNNDKTTFVDNVDSSVVKFYDKLKSEICKR
jgi:nicotinamide mononucleotide adenylyltransferase